MNKGLYYNNNNTCYYYYYRSSDVIPQIFLFVLLSSHMYKTHQDSSEDFFTNSSVSMTTDSQPGLFFFFFVLSLFVTEQAAGVYHRESRKGRYQLTYKEAKAVCNYEGGKLATYKQLEAARKIGLYINTSMVDNRFCMRNGYFSHLLVGNLGTNY